MRIRVVVFGKAGQLGRELVRVFEEAGHEVQSFGRSDVDIEDATRVENILAAIDPALVINAAAYNAVDRAEAEPAVAYAANAIAVRNLALASRQVDARLVHFSTDYVFDGTAGRPYTEEDSPRPLSAYGVSKLAGEHYAQAYLQKPLIIRTSGVFGPGGMTTARGNFPEVMLRLANGSQPIRVLEDSFASPTYAPYLAERTREMVEKELTGVYHLGGGSAISWFEFSKLIFDVAGLTPELRPTNEREYRTTARRPLFSALSNAKAEAAGISPMPPMRQAVSDYMQKRSDRLRATQGA